jgi:hypothetical protein
MSSVSGNARAGSARGSGHAVPAHARELAARLSVLFETDTRIVARLNSAQDRLRHANDRLWSGLAPDAFGLTWDGAAPAGHSQLAELVGGTVAAGAPGPGMLAALQEIHWQIHRAFGEYQSACEERRQLAVNVGELAVQLTDALCAAGFSQHDARRVDVHQLAQPCPASGTTQGWR